MKKILIAAALLFNTSYVAPVFASDNPCTVTLCMWGKLNGQSSKECKGPEREFFNIVKKKKGSFKPNKTFDARKKLLNEECPGGQVANQFIDKIMNKFGKVRL